MRFEGGILPGRWTRREFVRGAAGVVALPHLPSGTVRSPQSAYVASGLGAIHVYSLRSDAWIEIQQVASRAPACVLLSPSQRTLYVANEVDLYEGLPRGFVEAYSIDVDGRLMLLGRTALSLSATHPRNLAVSQNGKLLAVAAYGGGVYNLLPIAADGSLGQPCSIFKDAGCGPHSQLQASSHPHTLLFDTNGRHLLASDFGGDRVSVFALEDGRLQRHMAVSTGEGSGPGACALHPAGSFFYLWHDLERTLVCYRYDGASGVVGEPVQRLSWQESRGIKTLALHPSGRTLYSAHEKRNAVKVWHIDAARGKVSPAQEVSLGTGGPAQIIAAPDGKSVYILSAAGGLVYQMIANRATGQLSSPISVAVVNQPNSMALRTI
jgi:6-phosphogluconolactonase